MTTTTTRSTCPYCGVGCGVLIDSDGQRITGVRGDPEHPANYGRLCTKGSTLHLSSDPVIAQQTRLLQPMQRLQRGEPTQPISWDSAIELVATRIADTVRQHGPDAVGIYGSGQLLTEDYYVFNKLTKGLLGTNNIDTNSRLCMSSAVAGYKSTLGADAPPACYEDVQHAQCLFIVGSNAAWAHPCCFAALKMHAWPTRSSRSSSPIRAALRQRKWPTCTCPCSPAPMCCCFTACCTSCSGKAG